MHSVAHDDINENDQNFKTPSSTLMEKKKNRGHSHNFRDASQMNMRGIFLHVLADALGSVVVVISALVSACYCNKNSNSGSVLTVNLPIKCDDIFTRPF